MMKEVMHLTFLKREVPFYYFKHLYNKNVSNYTDYLSTKEVVAIGKSQVLHRPDLKILFDNKLFFALFCEKSAVNSPRLISHNLRNCFVYRKKNIPITTTEALYDFFKMIFDKENMDSIFLRPLSDFGGKGCIKLVKQTLKKQIDHSFDILLSGNFVHTQVIRQHEKINAIHSKSVNTIRIISLVTPEKEVDLICSFMRFGVGDNVVDNSASGGFFVPVIQELGELNPEGYYTLSFGGNKLDRHPESGFRFEGYKIPFFEEACQEVVKAVKLMPDRFIGWDIAISQEGPVIIEANSDPHIFYTDFCYQGLLKNKNYRNLIAELKN